MNFEDQMNFDEKKEKLLTGKDRTGSVFYGNGDPLKVIWGWIKAGDINFRVFKSLITDKELF